MNYFFKGTTNEKRLKEIRELLKEMNVMHVDEYKFDDPNMMYFTYDKDGVKCIEFGDFWVLWKVLENDPHPNYMYLEKSHEPLFKKGDWVNWKNTLIGQISELTINPLSVNGYSYCISNTLWATEKELKPAKNPIE